MKTRMADGKISPKAVLAALLPATGGLVAVIVQWVASGEFDRSELATAIGSLIAAALAFAGAWAGEPGETVTADQTTYHGERGLTSLEAVVVLLLGGMVIALVVVVLT
jgi:hypothetical protein